jgi:hypothetical protein
MKVKVHLDELRFDLASAKIGDVVVVTRGLYAPMPATLLKTFLGWVHLENPSNTWDKFEPETHYGYKIPRGTKITLIVGDSTVENDFEAEE